MTDGRTLATISEALATLREGRMLILVDDEDRENEGDLVAAAETITPEQVAFMSKQARGLICLALDPDRCDALGLHPMTERNTAPLGTAFTVSIDARDGVTTGVSALDRAVTIRRAASPDAGPRDFVSPGHVFPLRARAGGVLVRTGQTEGSVDLARLAGLRPAAVICEVLRDDGTMMRLPELCEFGRRHDLPVVAVADIVAHRLKTERFVEEVASADLPTDFGPFTVRAFTTTLDAAHPSGADPAVPNRRAHLALVLGDIQPDRPVLVRVHRANFPGDTFSFSGGGGREEVEQALTAIASEGCGVFLYLNREETGADLLKSLERVRAEPDPSARLDRAVRDESRMTFRDYGLGAQILRELGATRLRVLTNNPRRFSGLSGFGIAVEEFVPLR